MFVLKAYTDKTENDFDFLKTDIVKREKLSRFISENKHGVFEDIHNKIQPEEFEQLKKHAMSYLHKKVNKSPCLPK